MKFLAAGAWRHILTMDIDSHCPQTPFLGEPVARQPREGKGHEAEEERTWWKTFWKWQNITISA